MPSEIQYRQQLGRALDDVMSFTASSGTSTTVVVPNLINNTTNASTTRYDGRWVYIASGTGAGQQRVVRTAGYAPTTGTLTVTPNWSVSPSSDSVVVLTSLFPCIPQVLGEDDDYRTILNRALSRLLIRRLLTLSITTSTGYPLTAYTWLDRPSRLLAVREPPPLSGYAQVDAAWRGWTLRLNPPSTYLEIAVPFASAAGLLTLDVASPANTWIKVGSTWTETSPSSGITADSDEAEPTLEEVRTVGLMVAYESLMSRSPGRPNGDWAKKYADARTEARKLARYDRTQDAEMQASPEAA